MAETFGEADVVLRVRLDKLQRELDQAEAQIRASDQRVERSQQRVAAQMNESAAAAGNLGAQMAEAGVKGAILLRVVRTLAAIKAGATAVTVAFTALVSTMTIVLGVFAAFGQAARFIRNIPEILERIRDIDLADLFERARRSVVEFGRSALSSLGDLIVDSTLLRETLGRGIDELSRGLGFGALIGPIQDAREEARRFEEHMEGVADQAERGRGAVLAMVRASREARRSLELAAADTPEARVRVEGRHALEDIQRDARQRIAQLRQEAEQAVSDADSEAEARGILEQLQRQIEAVETRRDIALDAVRQEHRLRIEAARREEQQRQRMAEEQRRREQFQVETRADRFAFGEAAAQLEAEGEQIEAARVRLAESRRRTLRQIEMEGNDELLGLAEDFYDARQRLIDRREREQIERDRQLQERREQTIQDTRQRLMSQIRQAQLEAQGREVEARQEQIRQRFQSMIDQFVREGDEVSADLARRLGRLQLEAAERDRRGSEVARQQQFRQVALSRIAIDGMSGDDRVERDQLTELKRIRQNTRPANRAAVAG